MSLLDDLRLLLMDARMTLRTDVADFDDSPLRARLDQAIHAISEAVLPPPSNNTRTTAAQVALAWQTASRGLKLSHPPLYDELSARVMQLLDEKELVEPVTELLQLDEQVKALEKRNKLLDARVSDLGGKSRDAQARLDELQHALAAAMPAVGANLEPQPRALARIQALVEQGQRPVAAPGAKATPAAAAPDAPIPSREILAAVAAGGRALTREQREWTVAECLGLTGWQYTPIELIEKGDAWMAQQVLGAPNAGG